MLETMLDAFAEATGCDRAALGELVGDVATPADLSQHDLVERVAANERLANAAQAVQAHDLSALADSVDLDRPDELSSTAQKALVVDVAVALSCASLTARAKIADATRALADHQPLLELVGSGAVSMAGLRKVLDATSVLDPEDAQHVADRLACDVRADALTPGQLGKAALRRVLAADPEVAARRTAAARRNRYARLTDPVDGTAGIFARLRAEEALAVWRRLDRTARGMRGDGDERSLDTLRADLFVEWLTGVRMTTPSTTPPAGERPSAADEADVAPRGPTWRSIDGLEPWFWSDPPSAVPYHDPEPDDPVWDSCLDGPAHHPPADPLVHPGDPPDETADQPPVRRRAAGVELQVVVSAATLLGLDDEPALVRGCGAVPVDVVDDLIEAAHQRGALTTLRGLFCDPVDGRLVAMEQAGRFFTGHLRDFELYRDQHCRLTGGQIADVDHRLDHQHGGQTTARNGQGLGKLGHVVKDHPEVRVDEVPPARRGDGLDHLREHAPDLRWRLPSGHSYTRRPPPVLGPGSRRYRRRAARGSVAEQYVANLIGLTH